MIAFIPSAKLNKDAVVILVGEKDIKTKNFSHLPKLAHECLLNVCKAKHFHGKESQIFPAIYKKKLFLFAGIGKQEQSSLTGTRIAVKNACESSFLKDFKELEILPSAQDEKILSSIVEAIAIGAYTWQRYKTNDKKKAKKYYLVAEKSKNLDNILKIVKGVNLARDLVNDNADKITGDYLQQTVDSITKNSTNISLEILGQKEMQAKGLNLHLAVNQGSAKEPKLLIARYAGSNEKDPYTAIIGKGITFDAGGLNLKPTGHIETMREDMSGAAAVIGLLKNTLSLKIKKNILFVCAIAENAIGSRSYKPGDVIKSYSGKTVEILNTDAEGRLVLADAISYVLKNYKPKTIIDIATLTGACVVALGHDYSGLFSNDETLAKILLDCAKETDDRAWQLPIYTEIKDALKSKIADIKNIGYPQGVAGSITAAEFLHQFVGETTWAHLDIAGTAFVNAPSRLYFSHGATGAGVRLLTHYMLNY